MPGSWEVFVDDGPNAHDEFSCDCCGKKITADGLLWIQHSKIGRDFNQYCRKCVKAGIRMLLKSRNYE